MVEQGPRRLKGMRCDAVRKVAWGQAKHKPKRVAAVEKGTECGGRLAATVGVGRIGRFHNH